MSDLAERLRREQAITDQLRGLGKYRLLGEAADRIDELEAEVHRLHTAEFVGRLPDYVKEIEAERDEALDRIEQLETALSILWETLPADPTTDRIIERALEGGTDE